MGRLLGILGSFVACTALLLWGVTASLGGEAMARGRKLYHYRAFFDKTFAAQPTRRRRPLLWLGDSTIARFKRPSYPHLLQEQVRRTTGADSLIVAYPGFDPYSYYFVVGRLLERVDPSVVVIVAHLRAFNSKRDNPAFRYNDLSSYIPPALLPRTFLLPLSERQLSPARLLLAQSLDSSRVEDAFYTAEGLRILYDEAPAWDALGGHQPRFVFDPRTFDALKTYRVALTREQPAVRMLEATVRVVTDSGRVALVIVSPIPVEAMAKRSWYDPAAVQASVDVLRSVTEGAGGTLADFHALLPQKEFADFGGHYLPPGALHVSNAVWPLVRDALRRAEDAGVS